MHTFRFNPVFNQWVLLGAPVTVPLEIKESQLLDIGKQAGLAAATYPRQPFLLEPNAKHQSPIDKSLLYASQSPVGEYELLLFTEEAAPYDWTAKQWDSWLMLIQQRITQLHHNPYLHFVYFTFHTAALHSTNGYQRVGDLIAASHPVSGMSVHLDEETAEKLRKKEDLFVVTDTGEGDLYVPSAPLYAKEVWYLPKTYRSGIDQIEKKEREALAHILAKLMPALHAEFPEAQFCVTIHTSMAGMADDTTWWLQLYQLEYGQLGPLPVHPLPEAFVQHLHFLLKHHQL